MPHRGSPHAIPYLLLGLLITGTPKVIRSTEKKFLAALCTDSVDALTFLIRARPVDRPTPVSASATTQGSPRVATAYHDLLHTVALQRSGVATRVPAGWDGVVFVPAD